MTYIVRLPNLPMWTANNRGHWSQRAELVAAWRMVAKQAAKTARLPRLNRVAVTLTMTPSDRLRRDADNLTGALKPTLDGLVDAGVVADDSWRYVAMVSCRIEQPDTSLAEHVWLLEVTDLSDDIAA